MNKMHVAAYLVNRATCDHPECATLRTLRDQAFKLHKMTLITTIERQLSQCPDAQKEDDHETRTQA